MLPNFLVFCFYLYIAPGLLTVLPSPFPQLAMYMPGTSGMYIASWGKGERGRKAVATELCHISKKAGWLMKPSYVSPGPQVV